MQDMTKQLVLLFIGTYYWNSYEQCSRLSKPHKVE